MDVAKDAVFIRDRIKRLIKNDQVPLGVAQRLIIDSAWWYGHPHGPARAPKHQERISRGLYGWEIEFGANRFLIELAIRRSVRSIEEKVSIVEKYKTGFNRQDLKEKLIQQVQGSVANFDGAQYSYLYAITDDGFMMFGTQAINAKNFADTLINYTEINRIAN